MKYRKKPVVIEAIRAEYGYKNLKEIREFCGDKLAPIERRPDYKLKILTLEGVMEINQGDYIIQEPFDKERMVYPCKPDIFELTYDKAEKVTAKLTQTERFQHLINKTIEDDSGAYAKKYGDAVIRKITRLVKQKQEQFEIVYGRGK